MEIALRTFYVASTGRDGNPGSIARPFETLQYAHDQVRAGDRILVRGGTYPVSEVITLRTNGTRSKPIFIAAYPGERPIFDASPMVVEKYVVALKASWNRIRGLELIRGGKGGLLLEDAHHNIIERNDFHHNGRLSEFDGRGCFVYGTSSYNRLTNNDSHHNRDELGDTPGDDADGFAVDAGEGNRLTFNRSFFNSDDGFDLFNTSARTNVTSCPVYLSNNQAWRNGYNANGTPSGGNGIGFKMGGHRPNLGNHSGGHTLKDWSSKDNFGAGHDDNGADIPNDYIGKSIETGNGS